ncbi:hypothetical protein [Rhodococcus sp. UNC363MFTsu5.1]|uniref:hypothetical protein n=1 Tax=Rhodococcus sp. UNC363MFTsu5.1 TaxID=1449069 RepID=UPI000483BA5F|nr:hypothetical protein [Rhodococcus sp. UNC363MFTsu5.1]
MFRPTMRRIASVVFASAVLAGGLAAGTAAAAMRDPGITRTVENITVEKTVETRYGGTWDVFVPAGEVVRTDNRFWVTEGPERLFTRITDHGPDGFTYVPGSATLRIVRADYTSELIPIAPSVGSGTVSVVAPGAGWSIPSRGSIIFSAEYRAPLNAPNGTESDSGVTFDVAGHEGSLGWDRMGLNFIIGSPPVLPEPGRGSSELGFGS